MTSHARRPTSASRATKLKRISIGRIFQLFTFAADSQLVRGCRLASVWFGVFP